MTYLLLKLSDICKSYGPKDVLAHVSLSINKKDRIAIIGENGVGKSTLARLIAQREVPDSGKIEISPGICIGYLPQEVPIYHSEETVGEFLQGRFHRIFLEKQETEMVLEHSESQELLRKWELCHEQLQQAGAYDMEHRCSEILSGLGLSGLALTTRFSKLSGGQKSRVAFAELLLSSPDLLLLDEPTNHLDVKAVEWLEGYCAEYQGAILMISHDRTFINAVAHSMAELSSSTHMLTLYTGTYDDFLEEKRNEMERKACEFAQWKGEKKALHQFIKAKTFSKSKPPAPKDKNTMAYDHRGERHLRSQSRILRKAKDRLTELEDDGRVNPVPKSYKGIFFDPYELSSECAIEGTELSKTFGSCVVLDGVSVEILKGDRIILQGENGCGKTTLAQILLGITRPDTGVVTIAPSAKMGYLDQNLEIFPADTTVVEVLNSCSLTETEVREELDKTGLVDEGMLYKKIEALSLGQKKRLLLLFLMLSKSNVLFLDEPTNHLDLTILESLERALQSFQGAILAISHDRRFTKRVATAVWRLDRGKIHTER
jgi:ATPase subunit of ABC transporter with duplicated ATPase domains